MTHEITLIDALILITSPVWIPTLAVVVVVALSAVVVAVAAVLWMVVAVIDRCF